MNRLKVGAIAVLLSLVGVPALAQQYDATQAIRLITPSSEESIAALLDDDDPMEMKDGALIPHGCASRDLALVMMIEKLGQDGRMAGAVLNRAFLVVLEARGVCLAGRPVNALAIYDSAFALLNESRRHARAANKTKFLR
jgi:hypothetical protein